MTDVYATGDIIDEDHEPEPTYVGARDGDDLAEPEPEQWDLGDDAGNEPYANASGDYNASGPITDLVTAGHGFIVEKPSGLPAKMPPCRHCGGPLYPVKLWLCEVTLEAFTHATDVGCRCSWCIINRGGERPPGRGRPRAHCGKPACHKAQRREDNQRAYQRRKAKVASQ